MKKMSKSLGNYIGVTESPADMFGKLMSISDELMARYYHLLLGRKLPPEMHPLEAKKQLGAEIVRHLPLGPEQRRRPPRIGARGSARSDCRG